ncbi:MAG: hypothetical protein CML29_17840 [Rhizobiales bacterium]|nr:hypothetical protein [Hyphomicrobiales bacterium]MBA69646.1 hypothetical protein [Hyphomicrobiales bacterium]|tara:strand:+ start:301 stop:3063 length:2763 start_codon:yes stop_codon:yes gene_type:complete
MDYLDCGDSRANAATTEARRQAPARTKHFLAVLLLSTSLCSVTLTPTAHAQSAEHVYAIRAQPLSAALLEFSNASGIDIFFNQSMVGNRASGGLSGRHSVEEGLNRLLSGSGLSYAFNGNGAVTISDRLTGSQTFVADDGSLMLDTIDISAGGISSVYSPYETAAATAHISGETIERFRGSSPADMFRGTPGVMSGEARNGAGSIDPNVRGMQGMGRVTVKVDDAENQIAVYQGYQGISNRTFVDPDFIAGVDITKGSDASSGGIAGTVAIRTLDARDIVEDGKTFGLRLKGGFGTNTSSPQAGNRAGYLISNPIGVASDPTSGYGSATGSGTGMDRPSFLTPTQGSGNIVGAVSLDNVDFLAGYAYRERGNYHAGKHGPHADPVGTGPRPFCYASGVCPDLFIYRDYVENQGLANYRPGEEVLNTELQTESYLAKGTLRFGNGQSVKLGYTGYRSEAGDLLASALGTEYGQPVQQAQTTGVKLDTGTFQYRWQPDDSDLFDLKSNIWISKLEQRNPIRLRNWSNPPPASYGLPDDFRVGSDTTMWGGDISNTSKFDTSYGALNVNYGLSYKSEDTTPSAYTHELEGAGLRDGERQEAAIYGKASWEPLDWLTVNAGLRYQHYWSEDRSESPDQSPYDPDTYGQTLDAGGLSPSAGITLTPFEGTQFYVNYSNAMRSPSIMESLTGFSTIFNAALKPERSSNWEVGANLFGDDVLFADDRAMLKFGYFNWTVDDYISREFKSIQMADLTVQTMSVYNIDQAKFSGLELSTRYEIDDFTAELAANYYIDVEYCRTADTCGSSTLYGDYATNQVPPEYSVDLTLSQRFLDDALTAGGRVSYVGPRGAGHGEVTATGASQFISLVKWEPYTLVDVFAEYKINEHFTASARIENLFDQFYVDPLSLVTQPGPGRTFFASLTAKF